MSNTQTTMTCDLTAKTITIDGIPALRETVRVLLENHGDYDASDMRAIVMIPRGEIARAEAFAVDGDYLADDLDFDDSDIEALFKSGRKGRQMLKCKITIWAWSSSSVIVSTEFSLMNNPYNPSMEAPTAL